MSNINDEFIGSTRSHRQRASNSCDQSHHYVKHK
jgi:hypothetical protein